MIDSIVVDPDDCPMLTYEGKWSATWESLMAEIAFVQQQNEQVGLLEAIAEELKIRNFSELLFLPRSFSPLC
jgi:hypothetical protein